ncbi:MAG: class I SAM-dependent methyltransferase [Deltaproteobacteria bacterium]|nr:class I SAM-dependent methyltransferase [Deltaproteobacteria bacterium]
MDEIIKRQIEAYRPNFLEHGPSPKGTFQNNALTQRERHRQVLEPLLKIKPVDFTLCDIGSGLCDLHGLLNELKIPHRYTGVEIVPEMVEASKNRWPDAEIINVDLVNQTLPHTFDFVVLSGTFNIPGAVSSKDWETFVFKMIKSMFEHCTLGISFNFLTTYSTFRDNNLFYLSPEKVFSYAQNNLSRFCTLTTAYPLFEVTMSVFKPSAIKNHFSQPEFEKYFKK